MASAEEAEATWGKPTLENGVEILYVCGGCGFKSLFEKTMHTHAVAVHVPKVTYRAVRYTPAATSEEN